MMEDTNIENAIHQLTHDNISLSEVSPRRLNQNKRVVTTAVEKDGKNLQYASKELKKDYTIVYAAVMQNGEALKYTDSSMKERRDVVLAAVTQTGAALQFANKRLRCDLEVVTAAISSSPIAIKYAAKSTSKSFRNKKDIMYAAVKLGCPLSFAPKHFHSDRNFLLAALQFDPNAIQLASTVLLSDEEVVRTAIQKQPASKSIDSLCQYLHTKTILTPPVIKDAVQYNGLCLRYANAQSNSNKEIVYIAVQQDGSALQYAAKSLRSDKQIVVAAIHQNWSAFQYAENSLHTDTDVIEITKKSISATYASNPYTFKHGELCSQMEHMDAFCNNKDFILLAVKLNGISNVSISNRRIMIALASDWNLFIRVFQYKNISNCIPLHIRRDNEFVAIIIQAFLSTCGDKMQHVDNLNSDAQLEHQSKLLFKLMTPQMWTSILASYISSHKPTNVIGEKRQKLS